jgi:hypothetical protein
MVRGCGLNLFGSREGQVENSKEESNGTKYYEYFEKNNSSAIIFIMEHIQNCYITVV